MTHTYGSVEHIEAVYQGYRKMKMADLVELAASKHRVVDRNGLREMGKVGLASSLINREFGKQRVQAWMNR